MKRPISIADAIARAEADREAKEAALDILLAKEATTMNPTTTVTIKEETLIDLSVFTNPLVTFEGSKVRVTLTQNIYTPGGMLVSVAKVNFVGNRVPGRKVVFALPLDCGFQSCPEQEQETLREMARFALEAISDTETEAP